MAELWEGATKEEYHADPALSQSAIKDYLKDPQYFFQKHVAKTIPPKDPTPSQEFGIAIEETAFTGNLNAQIIPIEVMQRRNNADGSVSYAKAGPIYKAWELQMQAQHGPNVRLYKAEEFAKPMGPGAILQAVDYLKSHQFAARIIWGETVRTVRIKWTDPITGLECRCEIDMLQLAAALIGDLKTTRDPTTYGFARSVAQFGYDIQSYYYREALEALAQDRHKLADTELSRAIMPLLERIAAGEQLLCCWVAVKNSPSYHVEVHPCDADWYSIAGPIVMQARQDIADAHRTGHWQTRTFGTITNMKPPTFAFNRVQELAGTEE